MAANLPPAPPHPFRRAITFGPLVNDGQTFSGFLTVSIGTSSGSPVNMFHARGSSSSITAGVLTVGGTVTGVWAPGMALGGGSAGGFSSLGVASPVTVLSQLSGTTGGAGTYQLSANAPTLTTQAIYATAIPFTSAASNWSIQLPSGTSSALTTYTVTGVIDPTTITINNAVTVQYGTAPVPAIYMGTDNSTNLANIHAAALAAGITSVWFDPNTNIFAPNTLAMGNVTFLGDGSSNLLGSYQKRIIPYVAQSPLSVPRGCFVGNLPKLVAASSPVVVVLGDSITQTPPADQSDQTGYITAKIEQKLIREYAGRKTISVLGYGIGGTSWRNLASTSPYGTVTTTITTTNGSINATVASGTGITAGQPITAAAGIGIGALVASISGTSLVMTVPATANETAETCTFGLATLPQWYVTSGNTWWSYVVAAAPDVIVLGFGMNSDNAGDDLTAIYTVLTNILALSKVPDVIIVTPYIPSNVNPATNSQLNQERRRAHAGILRGIAKRGISGLNINLIDQNTWFMQARDGIGDQDTYLVQPTIGSVGNSFPVVGHIAGFTPWVAPSWTTDWFVMLQITTAQLALITTSVPLTFALGGVSSNNLEVYRTASGNKFAVRVRLVDVAATSMTTSSTSTGALTVTSGTGIVIGQKIVSTLFSAGTKVLSGSGTSWVASTNALSVGTDAATTFSLVPVDLFDTGLVIPSGTGPYYLRMTCKGNWVQLDYESAIGSTGTTTRLFGGYVEKFGGLFTPRLGLGSGNNVSFYEYALGQAVPRLPILTDSQCFGNRYFTGTGETEPLGGNTVNHMATPGQAFVYDMMLANEAFA